MFSNFLFHRIIQTKLEPLTEEQLIKGCLRGDRRCQKEVFQRYAGKMLVVCRRYTRHNAEAQDILQDSFIKVFGRLDQFRFQGSFEGWIRRIVVHTALKNYSKSSFKKEVIGIEDYQEGSMESGVISKLNREDLLREINNLPEGYKVVFNLYVVEGYSHREIADLLGIGESTSRSQLTKARKMLQSRLKKIRQFDEARSA